MIRENRLYNIFEQMFINCISKLYIRDRNAATDNDI